MKTAGIIGGIGPESTIEYYRLLVSSYREKTRDGSYPHLLINSVKMNQLVAWFGANQLGEAQEYLLVELRRLASAGADFGALAANTPHIVFEGLSRQSPIPLISIVEATCEAASLRGMKRLALFGTRFTMQAKFYPEVFAKAGISLLMPGPQDQNYIHEKYMGELVHGTIRPETRNAMLDIAKKLRDQHEIEGLILGGTELPLLLGNVTDSPVPFLDTTRIHVEAIVSRILE